MVQEAITNLTSKLRDTNGQFETSPLVDVGLEVVKLDVVPVDEHLIDCAAGAHVEESLRPRITIGVRGGGRASESVTLAGKRLNVLLPRIGGRIRIEVGLPGFVD